MPDQISKESVAFEISNLRMFVDMGSKLYKFYGTTQDRLIADALDFVLEEIDKTTARLGLKKGE